MNCAVALGLTAILMFFAGLLAGRQLERNSRKWQGEGR